MATKTANRNSAKKSTNAPKTATVVGAIGLVAATSAGGYAAGVLTSQDIQDFQPVYTVSQQELRTAKTALSSLEVRSDSTDVPDYDSATMPEWWKRDGCSTRYHILVRDILNEKTDGDNCKIEAGTMFDYYTGVLISYNRSLTGGGIDIDHIVAKGDAWESGGYTWSNDEWKNYIDNKNVLMATSASLNRSKGDKNASEWLPPNEDYWCKYIIDQINIKKEYDLSITAGEKAVMRSVLNTNCKSS